MTLRQAIDRLRERTAVPLFMADVWDPDLDRALRDADPAALFAGLTVGDPNMAACAVAGLHLWNDNFDGSHNLCQGINTQTASYWHGLCHRREGHRGSGVASNLGNARYWFRQVGAHPAFDIVYRSALGVLDNAGSGFRWATEAAGQLRAHRTWDPGAMIDWCAQADAGTISTQSQLVVEEIQWRELDLLTDWCVERALSS